MFTFSKQFFVNAYCKNTKASKPTMEFAFHVRYFLDNYATEKSKKKIFFVVHRKTCNFYDSSLVISALGAQMALQRIPKAHNSNSHLQVSDILQSKDAIKLARNAPDHTFSHQFVCFFRNLPRLLIIIFFNN